jgi:outer membrane receptor for ferrienterochelin and colicins
LLYGEAFRSPFAGEQAVNRPTIRGNPNLKPEESKTFNAQLFYNASKVYTALSYYKSTIKEAIQLTPDTSFFTFKNRGEFDFEGIEWEWKTYPLAGWLFTGSISYQINEDQNGTQDVGFIPNFMAKTGLAYESTSGVSFGIFNSYFGDAAELPGTPKVNPSADSYNWVTLKSSLDLSKYFPRSNFPNVTLNLFVDNLLDVDTHFPEFVFQRINTFPARRGIGVYGGATVRF